MIRLDLSPLLVDVARQLAPLSTPATRTFGFAVPARPLGDGYLLDTVASLALYEHLGQRGLHVGVELVANRVDRADLWFWRLGCPIAVNVHSTPFPVWRDDLHLYVPPAEIRRYGAFVMTVVHFDEPDDRAPHLHVGGWIASDAPALARGVPKPQPRTGRPDYLAIEVEVGALQPLDTLGARFDCHRTAFPPLTPAPRPAELAP